MGITITMVVEGDSVPSSFIPKLVDLYERGHFPFDKLVKAVQEDCDAAERCISPHVYRFRDGKWAVADQATPL